MNAQTLAIYFAGEAHRDQPYGESPYIYHLDAVDTVLREIGYQELHPVRIAAWLHDCVEDAGVTTEQLEKKFGPYVTQLVWRVTNEDGANRKERALKTYPKTAANEDAVALKLADRIANIENSLRTFSRFGLMYLKEHDFFYYALYDTTSCDTRIHDLWERYIDAIENMKETFGVKA